jgi:Rhodopirellula transposase DDE domain
VQRFTPLLAEAARPCRHAAGTRWEVDETYVKVHAKLDQGAYPKGVKVSDEELAAVPLRRHGWHGEWNYTVLPLAGSATSANTTRAQGASSR